MCVCVCVCVCACVYIVGQRCCRAHVRQWSSLECSGRCLTNVAENYQLNVLTACNRRYRYVFIQQMCPTNAPYSIPHSNGNWMDVWVRGCAQVHRHSNVGDGRSEGY